MGGGGGGGGVAVSFRPDKKSGGGGAVRFRPDTKSGEGLGGGCLAEEGKVPYMKGGVATCNPPNPYPPSASARERYTRQEYFASNTSAQSERVKKINSQLCRLRITRMFNAAGRPSDSTRPQPRWVSSYLYISRR